MKPVDSKTKIAWVGAGTMGAAMAGNLAKAGYRVRVWNRTTPSRGTVEAAAQGCFIATSLEEALDQAGVVCSCVTDGPALRSVLFAPGRSLKKLVDREAIVVDFSTIGPVAAQGIARDLSAQGLRFVGAPVTGGDVGARNATLTFMVGADAADLEAVRPLLAVLGKKIVHAGPVGSGQSLKLVNQLLCAANLLAAVEAFDAAEKLGMQKELVVEACGSGAAGSWQLVNLGPRILSRDHRPGFKAAHLLKDLKFLREALQTPPSAPELPCLGLALEAFERVCRLGQGASGTQAVWMAHPAGKKQKR